VLHKKVHVLVFISYLMGELIEY